jgi:hypothetical protein
MLLIAAERTTTQNGHAARANALTIPPATLFTRPMFNGAKTLQMRVSIDEIEPGVWRRLVLPVHWNLEHLHLGIQAAFKW